MSDPAVEAAERAWDSAENSTESQAARAGAREALAPLRELHRKVPKRNGWDGHWSDVCIACAALWPSPTDRLIYPSEEL